MARSCQQLWHLPAACARQEPTSHQSITRARLVPRALTPCRALNLAVRAVLRVMLNPQCQELAMLVQRAATHMQTLHRAWLVHRAATRLLAHRLV